jgi:anion-transporting  ArsA/GET3 family ATPase
MTLILTFLGKGGVGRTTIAIAAAKKFASQGKRVLLVGQDTSPAWGFLVGATPSIEPQELAAHLQIVHFQSTQLLERSWQEIKKLEAQYLRTPVLPPELGQELSVLPGMDSALALNTLRQYEASGDYDVIVYDGPGDKSLLRMLGMPETLSWYVRRFRQSVIESEWGKSIAESPFIQPLISSFFTSNWTGEGFAQPANQMNSFLEQGVAALSDPQRVAAYLVTTNHPTAIANARYLWGGAQQIGLTVGGVILNQSPMTDTIATEFAPLSVHTMPTQMVDDWEPLIHALPDFSKVNQAPRPLAFNLAESKVQVFLPSFDKKQVKLTQNGPELIIDAGDQRRHISLPAELKHKSVTGAKFQDGYLTISF